MIFFKVVGAILGFWALAMIAVILASIVVYGIVGLAG
jgi:hypothetical protein